MLTRVSALVGAAGLSILAAVCLVCSPLFVCTSVAQAISSLLSLPSLQKRSRRSIRATHCHVPNCSAVFPPNPSPGSP